MPEGPQIEPASRQAWRAWLESHPDRTGGVWFVYAKKAAPASMPRVAVSDAIEEALCFGWIDSVPRRLDEHRAMLWFSPRKPGSGWSRPNKERIARLEAAGQMHARGRAVIDAAKADGSWTLLDAVENLEVPDDLAAAFARYPGSAAQWEAFPRSAKRGMLEWVVQAKREPTRAKRVEAIAEAASRGERAY